METLQLHQDRSRAPRPGPMAYRRPAKTAKSMPDLVGAAWADLEELTCDPTTLAANRILTAQDVRARAFDHLRTRLVHLHHQHGWKRIAIVSPEGGVGRTTLLINLAFALSRQRELRTIAYDFDLRRPGMARLLGQSSAHDLGASLGSDTPLETHMLRQGMNMAFALNTARADRSAELLHRLKTEALLTRIEEIFEPDLMLFDMPPMLVADDAHGFLRTVDAALIVMQADRTPIHQIDLIERQVASLTNVAGIVLNRCAIAEHSDRRDG